MPLVSVYITCGQSPDFNFIDWLLTSSRSGGGGGGFETPRKLKAVSETEATQ